MKKSILILIGILLVGSILRLYQLGSVPPSPDWDEVALGWNGQSILQTGKDEYGAFLPIVLRSFDDYKPALYAYLTIPSTVVFGLNTFAVRLPSAIIGIMSILGVYLLIKELFKNEKLSLLTAFLFAISPWHIQFSRLAFETNVGLAFNIFTALFFIKGLRRPGFLALSAVFAALAIYVYQSEKIFTPLLILLLAVLYHKDLFTISKKYLIVAVLVGVVAIAPMAHYILTNTASLTRAQATLAFADGDFLRKNVGRLVVDHQVKDYVGILFDNRRVAYVISTASGWISHYDFKWLFLEGDIARHHAPRMGMMYLVEFPFLLVGLYTLLFTNVIPKERKRGLWLLLAWFFLAPVPASFTSGVPHSVRTLNFLPTFQFFCAAGALAVWSYMNNALFLKKKLLSYNLKTYIIGILIIACGFNFMFYLNQYFVQQNYFTSYDWQYGHKEAVEYVQSIEKNYKKVVISKDEPMDQAHMFYLFYMNYSPAAYQKENNKSGGFNESHKFSKYEFKSIKNLKKEKGVLYVGRPSDFEEEFQILKKIYYKNGKPAMHILQV